MTSRASCSMIFSAQSGEFIMPAPLDPSTCELVWNRWDQARVWVTAVLEAVHPADVSLSLFKKPSMKVNPEVPSSVVVAYRSYFAPLIAVQ